MHWPVRSQWSWKINCHEYFDRFDTSYIWLCSDTWIQYCFRHGTNLSTDWVQNVHALLTKRFCPQFDVLWNELTVEEHLLFYIRLKGAVPRTLETQALNKALIDFRLPAKQRIDELSGGTKRQLSIAIAFMGNPRLILLDEPTTSLDQTARHNIWKIINEHKIGRSVLMTTHDMSEGKVASCTW